MPTQENTPKVRVGEKVTMTDLRHGTSHPVRVLSVDGDMAVVVYLDDLAPRKVTVGVGFLTPAK